MIMGARKEVRGSKVVFIGTLLLILPSGFRKGIPFGARLGSCKPGDLRGHLKEF